ncbi:Possible Transcriptional Regulator [Thiobacillus denitrificans ATCC 25259]|uniref:Possible Transcriptional Regulator n=1 Tax=Thiobacillus denitrificans (strain ATCC 25259 / T1) TaxID=292415 RepID=Q3SIK2_THIDA|nr:helix-turn-helix domain-containing protein [Thiobacillus denitrificans]AAZ97526.1 Possible Transcriptional Regulator [Thiobacillus denitrificans ATCC 25259]
MDLVEHILTTEDMMAVLRVSRRTLDDYLAKNKLPQHFRIGRRVYWHRQVVEAWLRQLGEVGGD